MSFRLSNYFYERNQQSRADDSLLGPKYVAV